MKQYLDIAKKQLKDKLPALQKDFFIQKIGIFGSVAKGEDTPTSDIDILVHFSNSPGFFTFIKLEEHLSGLLNRKVDLVTQDALKDTIKNDILRHIVYV
jgi:predicted nucleotidyltransferase